MTPKIKQFITDFTLVEYDTNVNAYNSQIDLDIHYEKYVKKALTFWELNSEIIGHKVETLKSIKHITEEMLRKRMDNFFKRELFQITEYENPIFGENLAEKFPNIKKVYRCFLSDCVITAMPKLTYTRAFSAIEFDDTFKFIYRERFIDGKWEAPNDYKPDHILDFGTIKTVESFLEPEEENSLKLYNEMKKFE
jgi:hypothetical protein